MHEAFTAMVDRGDTVTVAALCREADINRSTFYGHYDTLDDLKMDVARSFTDDMVRLVRVVLAARTAQEAHDALLEVGHHYEQNVPLYIAVAGSNPDHNAMSFRDELVRGAGEPTLESTVCADFVLSSVTAIFHSWVVGLYGAAPMQEIVDLVTPLVVGALGLAA